MQFGLQLKRGENTLKLLKQLLDFKSAFGKNKSRGSESSVVVVLGDH